MKSKKPTWSNQYIPSRQSMIMEQHRHAEYDRLGIDVSTFSDLDLYTKDELAAIKYILNNKKVPIEVEKRLIETKEQRTQNKCNKHNNFNEITDADILSLVNNKI